MAHSPTNEKCAASGGSVIAILMEALQLLRMEPKAYLSHLARYTAVGMRRSKDPNTNGATFNSSFQATNAKSRLALFPATMRR